MHVPPTPKKEKHREKLGIIKAKAKTCMNASFVVRIVMNASDAQIKNI